MKNAVPDVVDARIVATTCAAGRLRGLQHDHTCEFRGIRYASARRLQEPIDELFWNGEHDGLAFGAQAPQVSGVLEAMLDASEVPDSDDCLFINVWTPACDGARRPVLFWIHGGSYLTGSGSMPWHDGNALAERGDVVVVSINYRLGALGFLGDRNLGILDMMSALRWVQRNIADFGGHPDQVTLFGESAGGSALLALLATPSAQHLFHRVWSMSPSIPQLRTSQEGADLERTYLDLLGVEDAASLEGMTLERILGAQAEMSTGGDFKNFAPTEGTELIPGPMLRVASADPRPVVVGTTRDEMLLFTAFDSARRDWTDADVEREFASRFDDPTPAIDAYRNKRPEANPSQLVSAMQTDEAFRAPVQRYAAARSSKQNRTWVYEFHQTSTAFRGRLGACHGLDLPFVFHNLTRRGVETFTGGSEQLAQVADQFSDALLAFAHTGSPGWPNYDTDHRATQIIGPEPRVDNDPDATLRRLWA